MRSRIRRSISLTLIVCLLALNLIGIGADRVLAEGNRLVSEDFEDGVADSFVLAPGSGAYTVTTVNGNKIYSNTNTGGPEYSYYNGTNLPADYSVEANVEVNAWGSSTPAAAGLFLKYTDSNTYYAVGYEKSSNAIAGSRFSIRKRFNGTTTYLAAQSTTTAFTLNTVYKMKGEVVGNKIKMYVNDVQILEATDDSNPLSAGYPGLFALRANIEYDNFSVFDATPISAPNAPTNLITTSNTGTTVDLRWNPSTSPDVTDYLVFHNGQQLTTVGRAVYTPETQTVTAQVYNLIPGTTYNFSVKALGKSGVLSDAGNSVTVTTDAAVVPLAPSKVRAAEKTSTTIKLVWDPSISLDVTGYRIYSGETQVSSVTPITYDSITRTYSVIISGLEPNTAYRFTVKAVTGYGLLSAASNECSETTAARSGSPAVPLPIAGYRASSSDVNLPEYAVDGDITTRWSAFDDGQWMELDLGALKTVGYLGVAFYRGDQRSKQIKIELSSDQTVWTQVYSGTSSGRTIQPEAFGFHPSEARYVRVTGLGASQWTSITEIQVYEPHPDGYVLAFLEAPPAGPDPNAPVPTKPGLYEADGAPHLPHVPQAVTGRTINVADFGASPLHNGLDDAQAIRAALDAAQPGDEVYIPNGHYQLTSKSSDNVSHLTLKSGVQLRGESQDGVLLVSDHSNEPGEYAAVEGIVIRIAAQNNIRVSNMTITSSWNLNYSSNTVISNPDKGGPKQAIAVSSANGKPSYNITLDHLTVEKFQRIGVAIINSHDVVVEESLFRNATDLAEGGSGYAVSIEGKPKESRLGREDDTYFNVVRSNRFIGPYIRHGTLLSFYPHNNLVESNYYENIALDAIDFHGEDEYMNEVRYNRIVGGGESGIGVGNPGASHDAAGPGNYIHHNTIENTDRYGIQVYLGSPDTIIENNTIINFTKPNTQGIRLKNAPGTIVRGNRIEDNTAANFWGLVAMYDNGDPGNAGNGAGAPANIGILNNRITGNSNGVDISAGTDIVLSGNEISGNIGTDYINRVAIVEQLTASEAASIRRNGQLNSGGSDLLVKGGSDDDTIRTYLKFDLSQVKGSIAAAWLHVYGRAMESGNAEASVANSVYGVEDDSWSGNGLVWNSSVTPPALVEKQSTAAIRNDGIDAVYQFDATLFVKDQLAGDKTVSLAIAQDREATGYLTRFYNGAENDRRPYLRVETYPPLELASVSVTSDKKQLAPNSAAQLVVSGKMNTGDSVSLAGAELVYESLTPDIASVNSNGLVTAVHVGNAVIKVTAALNGVTKSGTITLIVSDNLALYAQLSVDSTNGVNVKERVVDGDLKTRWVSSGGALPRYLRLDWTSAQTVNQVKLWSGHIPVTGSAGWHAKDFDLEYLDGSEWKLLAAVRNNDKDAFLEQFTLMDFDPVTTSSIRLNFMAPSWGNGNLNDMTARINEIAVRFVERIPGPSDPGPSDPGPSDPGPSDPGPSDPGPSDPGPIDPGPSDPGPSDPGPSDPGPSDPGPSDPGPSDPGPSDPAPSDPSPSNPDKTNTPAAENPAKAVLDVVKGKIHVSNPEMDNKSNNAKIKIDSRSLEKAFEQAEAREDGTKTISIDIAKADHAASYTTVLPAEKLIVKSSSQHIIEVKTAFGIISLPDNILANTEIGNGKDIEFTVSHAETSALPQSVRSHIGNRPVIDLHFSVDGQSLTYNNPDAPVQVSIPYQPADAERNNLQHIVVWYLDGNGHAAPVTDAEYDAGAGAVTFTTTHFSQYAVAFVNKTFEDTAGYSWAIKEIGVMAAKGIVNGTTEHLFSPGLNITRAEFTAMLARSLKLNVSKVDRRFSDVRESDWFYLDVSGAYQAGLVEGRGNGFFTPNEPITREEMAVLIGKAVALRQGAAMKESDTSDFSRFMDYQSVSEYAKDSVALTLNYGLMKGEPGGMFAPKSFATRAQAAVVLYRLFYLQ
jgi:hypothetical protein